MELSTGHQIGAGRFEVLNRIGEGAGGIVYAVKDRQSDSRLALKAVRGAEAHAIASLKREFRAVQDITHPHLVRLDELFEEGGVWFFTMELVDGQDWLSYVRPSSAGADVPRLRASLIQIVEALAALHAKGMIHRDVKPSNVLVTTGGHVKLLDFGITSAKSHASESAFGVVVGTPAYMAPEQLLAEEPTPACDFYALGVMLYQALSGKLPYFERGARMLDEKLRAPPTPVRQVARDGGVKDPLPDDLAEMCDELLRREPSERPGADALLRALGAGGTSSGTLLAAQETFVGRGSELGALRAAYADVRAGRTVAVLVEGASGVGKSALVSHFVDEVGTEALVLRGRCHEREYVPYKGIDAIVDELAAFLEADASDDVLFHIENPAMRLLPRLFPTLRRVGFFAKLGNASSFATAEGDASELRARIFGAFREMVGQIAQIRSLVLAIDDVQWADGDSIALLGDLLAPPAAPPVLLLCTRRFTDGDEGERSSVAAPVPLPGDLRVVRLSGLSDDDMASLAAGLSAKEKLGEDELRELAKESAGHPLFLQELVRRRASGHEGEPLLLRLDDALWTRVLALEPEERHLVEATAVAGVPTSLDVIASAARIERSQLAARLAQLRGASLVKLSGNPARRRIEPYHDRVREAVLHNLGADGLRGWHERLAHALEAAPDRDVDRLALHWEGAGDATRAAALLREAGDRASQALAFDRAVELYRRARTLGGADPTQKLELSLAQALFDAGRGRESGEAFLALAGAETDRRAIELRVNAVQSFLGSGYFGEGIDAARGVLGAVGLSLPDGRFGTLVRIVWHLLRLRMRGFVPRVRAPSALPATDVLRVDACISTGFRLGMADVVRGQCMLYLATRLALDLGDPGRAARALCGFAICRASGGIPVAAITAAAIDKARELASKLEDPYVEGLIDGAHGYARFMLEDWSNAEAHLGSAERAFRDLRGAGYELSTMRMMRGRALLQLGRLRDLAAYQGPALRDAIRRNDVYAMSNTRATVSALLALARDDVAEAEGEIAEAARILSSYRYQLQHIYCLQAACAADLYRGAPERVHERLAEQAAALRASLFERVQSIRATLESLRARAHLALAARSKNGRAEHLAAVERSARVLVSYGLPGMAAHAKLLRASGRAIDGDTAGAVEGLLAAVHGFGEQKMVLHAASARMALGALVGGDEGRALDRAAKDAFESEGVLAPVKYAAHYAPGFGLGA